MATPINTGTVHGWRAFYLSGKGYTLTWLALYLLTAALASTIFFYQIPLPQEKLTLKNVEYVASNAKQPSEFVQQNWQSTTLPDDWQSRNLMVQNVWYRGTIHLNSQQEHLWAVLIPALKMNAAVYLNNTLLGSGGRFDDPVARNWMTPLLFTIPAGLLQQGDNTLYVRVKSDPTGTGNLAAIHLGPYDGLAHAYNVHYMFRISSIQLLTTMLFIMGALIALLWLVRRQETYYGYYALAVIVWGLHNFNIFIIDIPVSTRLWDWLIYTSLGYYTFLAFLFIHRFLGIQHPWLERVVIASGMLAAFALLFPTDENFYPLIFTLWYPAVYVVGFYLVARTCIEAWKRRSIELQFLTATGGVTLLYALHDLMVIHGYQDWQDGFFIQYAAAALMTVFSFILMRRFAGSLNEIDHLNRNLEKRVADKGRLLEANYKKLQQLENERVLAAERERLTRDIHDGMGGNLVSTLAMIESGNTSMPDVAEALKTALTDLRLMIDSMDIESDDLNTLLGMFRMRIEPCLKNSRINMHWKVDDLPPIQNFGPREALHILRILQEATTNVIKHAQSDYISLSTHQHQSETGEQAVIIELSDNGTGIPQNHLNGNGLKNMHRRAVEAGVQLNIKSGAEGTRVCILLTAI